MNKREHKHFTEYYDQETLNRVNLILKEDFALLDYKMINDITSFLEESVESSLQI